LAGGAKPWSSEDDRRLRVLYATLSAVEVARQLGRSVAAIRHRAHKIGCTKTIWNRNLSELVRGRARDLYARGLTMEEIQEREALSYHQVRWCLGRGRATKDIPPGSKALAAQITGSERQEIIAKATTGLQSLDDVAKEHGYNRYQIRCVLREEGVDVRRWWREKARKVSKTRPLPWTPTSRITFSPSVVAEIVRDFTVGMQTQREIAKRLGCGWKVVSRALREAGVDKRFWAVKKAQRTQAVLRSQGKISLSPRAGRGRRTYYKTPFQGVVCMRSSTEAARARELDASGVAWFYEVRGFGLSEGVYTPDFWIAEVSREEAEKVLGVCPDRECIRRFLCKTRHVVEDVKGWFNEKHPSRKKIAKFRAEYPLEDFRILVIDRNGRQEIRL